MENHSDDAFREVRAILDHRKVDENIQLLIQWRDDNKTEWRWLADCDCPILLFNYLKELGVFDEDFEVEGIIDSIKNDQGETEYLVKWVGFGINRSTWVKQSEMNCDELIEQFNNGKFFWYPRRRIVYKITQEEDRMIPHYQVHFEYMYEPDREYYSIDEVYIMPNGRKALCKFHKKFL